MSAANQAEEELVPAGLAGRTKWLKVAFAPRPPISNQVYCDELVGSAAGVDSTQEKRPRPGTTAFGVAVQPADRKN
jgi:hypothetical protein